MRRGGRTAEQNVCGRMPRLPQMLLLSGEPLRAFEEGSASQRMEFTAAARVEAVKAAIEVEASVHLRRAVLRKTRPLQAEEYTLGMKVGFWREHTGATTAKPGAGRDETDLEQKDVPGT